MIPALEACALSNNGGGAAGSGVLVVRQQGTLEPYWQLFANGKSKYYYHPDEIEQGVADGLLARLTQPVAVQDGDVAFYMRSPARDVYKKVTEQELPDVGQSIGLAGEDMARVWYGAAENVGGLRNRLVQDVVQGFKGLVAEKMGGSASREEWEEVRRDLRLVYSFAVAGSLPLYSLFLLTGVTCSLQGYVEGIASIHRCHSREFPAGKTLQQFSEEVLSFAQGLRVYRLGLNPGEEQSPAIRATSNVIPFPLLTRTYKVS